MAEVDDFLASLALEKKPEPKPMGMMDAPKEEPVGVPAPSGRLITGSLAKAHNKHPTNEDSEVDQFLADLDSENTTGKKPAKREYVLDDEEIKIKTGPKEPVDALLESVAQERRDKEQPLQLLDPRDTSIKEGEQRYRKKTGEGTSGLGRPLLIALNAEENAIVGGIRKSLGKEAHKDTLDNTYENLLVEYGADRDSPLTTAAGLGLSIFAVPSTYLTFGTAPSAKIGQKAALSSYGRKVADSIIKERVEKEVLEKGLDDAARNVLAQKTRNEVHRELTQHFEEISEDVRKATISPDISKLKSNVFDRGGVKFMGKTVLNGHDIAEAVEKTRVDKVFSLPSKAIQAAGEAPGVQATLGAIYKATAPVQETVGKYYKRTKDAFGELFVPQYKLDKKVAELWDETMKDTRGAYDRAYEHTKSMFDRYGVKTTKQKEDFFNSINEAFGNEELKGKVASKSGDPVVQRAIDRWLGQGEFKERRAIADKMARYAKLLKDDEQVNWIPGIDKRFVDKILDPKLDAIDGPSKRSFNIDRKADAKPQYLTDPVQAIALRRTQAYIANLQDKMYENIVKNKLGEPKKFATPYDAAKEGYVPFIKPYEQKFQKDSVDEVSEKASELVYVKKEFYDQYKKLVTSNTSRMTPGMHFFYKVLEKPTNVYKQHVTSMFPSFHARNFTSNLVLNSMSIGGHAVNPVTHKHAMDMVRGVNLDKTLSNSIGEKLTLKTVLNEAYKEGVLKSGAYFADIGGDLLPNEGKTFWHAALSRMNPLSPNFAVSPEGKKLGGVIEDQAKLVNYLTWRMKGLSPKQAALEAKEALFDYGALTDQERWAKLVIPFYTFSKKNLEKHMKLAAHRPGVITAQMKAMEKLGPTDKDWENMPEWAKNKFVMKMGNMMTSGYGAPLEDILSLTGGDMEVVTRVNPLFRYPLEKWSGKDAMSGRPLEDLQSAKEWKMIYQISKDSKAPAPLKAVAQEIVDYMGLKRDRTNPTKIVGDYEKLHLLRNMFTSRYMSTIGMLNGPDKDKLEKAARLVLGVIKIKPDRDVALSNKKRETTKEAIQYYKKMGGKGIYIFVPTSDDTDEIRDLFKEMGESESQSELRMTSKDLKRTVEQEFR